MSSIVLARSSIGRKKPYRIVTTIEKHGQKLKVRKQAALPEATEFLRSLPKKTSQLKTATKHIKDLEVVDATQEKDSVYFDYVEGATLDEEFAVALFKRDQKKISGLFGEVLEIIDSLSTTRGSLTPKAINLFGNFASSSKLELIDCGYMDFNLDNFIRGKDKLYMLDAEFLFDFGVPKQHVINRLIVSYLQRYSYLTGSVSSDEFPVLVIADNLFVPKVIWDKYGDRFSKLPASERVEKKFQQFYNDSKGVDLGIKPEGQWQVITQSAFQDVSMQIKNIGLALATQLDRYNELEAKLQQTKAILENYRSNWLVKAARKAKQLRNHLNRG